MNISDLLQDLQTALDTYGDLEIVAKGWSDGFIYSIESAAVIDVCQAKQVFCLFPLDSDL